MYLLSVLLVPTQRCYTSSTFRVHCPIFPFHRHLSIFLTFLLCLVFALSVNMICLGVPASFPFWSISSTVSCIVIIIATNFLSLSTTLCNTVSGILYLSFSFSLDFASNLIPRNIPLNSLFIFANIFLGQIPSVTYVAPPNISIMV